MRSSHEGKSPKSIPPDQQKIIDELHNYSRGDMSMFVQWFTFFVTINYVALGWFAEEISKGEMQNKIPLYYVAGLFIVQGALGIWVSVTWRIHLLKLGRLLLARYRDNSLTYEDMAFSHGPYSIAIGLGTAALAVIIVVWVGLIIAQSRNSVPPNEGKSVQRFSGL